MPAKLRMSPKARKRWSETRAKGKLDYVLKTGVLSYGLPMFVIMTFFIYPERRTYGLIAISALLWLLGGIFFGVMMWHVYESRYAADSESDAA